MAIDYQPLLRTMKEKQITWYQLQQSGVDNKTCHQLRHNRNITINTLEKLCKILGCTPNDIICFSEEEKEKCD